MLPICFHCYLRRHCTMHTLNLGIYLTVNAEGLLMLAALRVSQYQYCNLDEALSHLYDDFRDWCTANRTTCSQRRWCSKQLHLESDGVHTFPWLHSKAFNARVILGWLADPFLKISYMFLEQRYFHYFHGANIRHGGTSKQVICSPYFFGIL